MEIELERRLVALENSMRDVQERLAEVHREMAGLSIERSSVMKKVRQDAGSFRKSAEEVKRLHAELSAKLSDVSGKLSHADVLVKRLSSLRRAAKAENRKEIEELAASVLRLNKNVSRLSRHFEERIAVHQDPRMEALYAELASMRIAVRALQKAPKFDSAPLEKEVSIIRKSLRDAPRPEKVDLSPFKKELDKVGKSVRQLQDARKSLVDEGQLRESITRVSSALVRIESALFEETRSLRKDMPKPIDVSPLESEIKGLKSSMRRLEDDVVKHRSHPDADRVDSLDKRIEEIRARTNSILRELYDNVDALKSRPRAAAPMEQSGPDGELGALKASLGTDMKNLKAAVAELSNKTRLINDLALENQKLQSRLFTLEGMLAEKVNDV